MLRHAPPLPHVHGLCRMSPPASFSPSPRPPCPLHSLHDGLSRAAKVFRSLDVPPTGEISLDQLRAGARKLGYAVDDDVLESAFVSADLDRSSTINVDEFVVILAILHLLKGPRDEEDVDAATLKAFELATQAFLSFDSSRHGFISRVGVRVRWNEGGQAVARDAGPQDWTRKAHHALARLAGWGYTHALLTCLPPAACARMSSSPPCWSRTWRTCRTARMPLLPTPSFRWYSSASWSWTGTAMAASPSPTSWPASRIGWTRRAKRRVSLHDCGCLQRVNKTTAHPSPLDTSLVLSGVAGLEIPSATCSQPCSRARALEAASLTLRPPQVLTTLLLSFILSQQLLHVTRNEHTMVYEGQEMRRALLDVILSPARTHMYAVTNEKTDAVARMEMFRVSLDVFGISPIPCGLSD